MRRKFLLSELLALIPPAIASSSGVTIDDEVELPIPASQGNDIRLSLLYHVCPQLFAAEITPLNDSTITLPGRFEEAEGAKDSSMQATAFSQGPSQARKQPEAKADPVAWTQAKAEVEMKDRDSERPDTGPTSKEAANPSSSSPPKEMGTPNPFSQGGMKRGEAEKVPGGFDNPGIESESGAPFEWPPEPKPDVEEPKKPEMEEEKNPFTSSEGFSTLFSKKALDDSDIPFPETEEKAPESEVGAQSGSAFSQGEEAKWGSMFDAAPPVESEVSPMPKGFAGFGEMLHQSSPQGESEPETAPEPEEKKSAPEVSEEKFVQEPLGKKVEEIELVEQSPNTPEPEMDQERVESVPANPWANAEPPVLTPKPAKPDIEVTASVGPLHSQTKEKIEDPAESAALPFSAKPAEFSTPTWLHKASEAPVENATEAPVQEAAEVSQGFSAPVPEPEEIETHDVSESAPALPFLREGEGPNLILRAIFSTDENFTFSKLARKVVALPGINGCALATQSRLVQASTSDRSRVGDHARDMVSTIRNLASFTGLSEAKVFTLHTDKGIVSLFLEGSCCLTVHQDAVEFGPGTREKLTLIARCLEELKE